MTVSRRTFIKGLAASGAAISVSTPALATSGDFTASKHTRPENAPNLLIVFPDECEPMLYSLWGKIHRLHQILINLPNKPK